MQDNGCFSFFAFGSRIIFLSGIFLRSLFAEEHDPLLTGEEPLFVSLGSACEVASKIEDFGFRRAAFPFDWILALDTDCIIRILNDDFQNIMNEDCFQKHPYLTYAITHTFYNIEFRHEWTDYDLWSSFSNYKQNFTEIKEKYQRRIKRFKSLNSYQGPVYFIRAAIDFDIEARLSELTTQKQRRVCRDDAILLRDKLRELFPSLNFKLVVINYPDELPDALNGESDIIEFKFLRGNKSLQYGRLFQEILSGM